MRVAPRSPAAASERSRLAIGEASPPSGSTNRTENSRIAPASGQIAQETQAAKPAAAPVRTASPPRPVAKTPPNEAGLRTAILGALRGERSPPLGKNACDITGIGDTLDGCHHDMSSDPAETVHESGRVAHKSSCELDNQRLHFVSLRAI